MAVHLLLFQNILDFGNLYFHLIVTFDHEIMLILIRDSLISFTVHIHIQVDESYAMEYVEEDVFVLVYGVVEINQEHFLLLFDHSDLYFLFLRDFHD